MTAPHLLDALARWNPDEDLPEEVALALDADPALRAAFDARFPPVSLPEAPPAHEPAFLVDRVTPARRARPWQVVAVALPIAAGVTLAVGAVFSSMRPGLLPHVPTAEIAAPAEASRYVELQLERMSEPPPAAPAGDARMLDRLGYADAPALAEGKMGGAPHDERARRPRRHADPTATETYTDHGRNPRVLTATDPLSTFSVDVDTGSWSVVRRRLREGFLPPAGAVRVEEMINAFTYRDPAPTDGPFQVTTEAVRAPWDPATHLVRIGLQGRRPEQRIAAHLTFLVDTSGSMRSPDKLELCKQGLRLLVDQLRDGDTVAIVAYAGGAGLVLPPTGADDKARIRAAIDGLEAGGSTAMGAGLQLAYDLAEQTRAPGATNRVILLSDGDANVGETRHGALAASIRHYADEGIALTTVGVGEGNYRDTMMEQLADQGDGQYVYLDGEPEARRLFVDQLPSTLDVLARDVKVQVAWDPAVVSWYRLVGYEDRDVADADFRNDPVDAGEVGVGHHVTALYEVALVEGSTRPLGEVRLRYKPPGPDAPAVAKAWSVRVDPSTTWTTASHDTRLAVGVAAFAEKLRGGVADDLLSWPRLEQLVAAATRPDVHEEAELRELVGRASRMVRQ